MSAFDWQTGEPSIFSGLQKDANIARKASANLSAKLATRPDPVNLRKKPNRNGSGRTIPLGKRIDLQAVYDYRITGKTWDQCAQKFGCSTRHIHQKMTDTYPELRHHNFRGSKPGRKPMDLDIAQICADIHDGMTIRAIARQRGLSHVSLGYRLRQTPEGMAAVSVARQRNLEMNEAKKEEARKRREAKNAA